MEYKNLRKYNSKYNKSFTLVQVNFSKNVVERTLKIILFNYLFVFTKKIRNLKNKNYGILQGN